MIEEMVERPLDDEGNEYEDRKKTRLTRVRRLASVRSGNVDSPEYVVAGRMEGLYGESNKTVA
jgi:hypothetical protein